MTAYRTLCSIHTSASAVLAACLLASCSSPPRPPTVDDRNKRPVNSEAAIQLQACRAALTDSTLVLNEIARGASAQGAASRVSCAPAMPTAPTKPVSSSETTGDAVAANVVAVVPFAFASATWPLSGPDADQLVQRAHTAHLVMIRGRTDSVAESVSESLLAKRRAEAAAGFLRTRGVPPERLRVTWQGAGDHLADTTDRAKNRRVEIEFYGAPPSIINLTPARTGV